SAGFPAAEWCQISTPSTPCSMAAALATRLINDSGSGRLNGRRDLESHASETNDLSDCLFQWLLAASVANQHYLAAAPSVSVSGFASKSSRRPNLSAKLLLRL